MVCLAAVESPIRKHWALCDQFLDGDYRMLEFHLVYQGLLPSSGNKSHTKDKHLIRRYLHRQLANVWEKKHPLKARSGVPEELKDNYVPKQIHQRVVWSGGETDREELIEVVNGKRYLPIVSENLALSCKLNILLLSMGSNVMELGDLDGRVKTIVDALKVPRGNDHCEGDEDPLYCLVENDSLISDLRVTADLLLAPPPEQVREANVFGEFEEAAQHAFAVIHVAIKPTRIIRGNLDFV